MIGHVISHYKILEKLGEGGMGVVYKAHDTKLNRDVALKFLPHGLTSDPKSCERFTHEAQAASALQHTNICTIHDIDTTPDGQLFIVMDCYIGETLSQIIDRGPLKTNTAIDITVQIATGLKKAHDSGIVHRDIKPANIILTNDGIVKIVDFGLAKLRGRVRLTKEGVSVGTVEYMSPEQVRGEEVDQRTDIWSLGVVLYEILAGHLPFKSEYEQATIYSILNEEPRPIVESRPDILAELEQIVTRMLQKNRDVRYQNISQVIADLHELKSGVVTGKHSTDKPRPSIAVLPFANLSADTEQEYFCDGLAEELIHVLTHIEGLRVVARTSAFAFKGKHMDVREIGRKLNVEAILEGSVRKFDNRLRITAQLVKVADGFHVWSEAFDRTMQDIYAIQNEISLAITEHLKVRLLEGEKAKLIKPRTHNLDAYNLYLKGRFFFNQRKDASIRKSIECYSKAIEIDPDFTLAYTGLAESYIFLGDWRLLPLETAYAKAREAALAALQIDDSLAEVHLSVAEIKLFCDWNWREAEIEFRKALNANPAHAEAHHMYAHYLELSGKFDLALAEINRALELEPVSPSLHACAVQVLFYARRYEEAIRQCHAAMEMAPTYFGLYGWLGIAYVQCGVFDRGIEALEKGLQHIPEDPRLIALTGYSCGLSGNNSRAQRYLEQLVTLMTKRHVDPYFLSWLYVSLNDRATALTWLDKAYSEHSEWLPWMMVDPLLDALRSDRRFTEILGKLRLE